MTGIGILMATIAQPFGVWQCGTSIFDRHLIGVFWYKDMDKVSNEITSLASCSLVVVKQNNLKLFCELIQVGIIFLQQHPPLKRRIEIKTCHSSHYTYLKFCILIMQHHFTLMFIHACRLLPFPKELASYVWKIIQKMFCLVSDVRFGCGLCFCIHYSSLNVQIQCGI